MTNPTSAVNPNDESIAQLSALPDTSPIIMVNLLKFSEPAGRERYMKYGAVAGKEIASRGGRVIYGGRSIASTDWDHVALVFYPRRAAYLDMQNSEAYRNAIPDRTGGLAKRLLFAFKQGSRPTPLDDVRKKTDDEIFVVNLLRYDGEPGRDEYMKYGAVASELIKDLGGEMVLYLDAEQAMVTDDDWQNFILVRYPSIEALRSMTSSDEWQRANKEHREVGLANTIAFPTRQT